MTRDELSTIIGEVLKDWWYMDQTMGATQERLAHRLEPFLMPQESPVLAPLLAALGWQVGTVEQALAEVRRLKALESPMVEIGHVDLLGSVVWKDFAGIDAYKKIGLKVYAVSRDNPLGQGVAALLPEHGEAKP